MPPRREIRRNSNNLRSLNGGGFSYRAIGARVQRNSSTVMRVWKQWTHEHRTSHKTGSGRRKVTSARDDRHLLRIVVNDRTASSRQLAARRSTATGVLMTALSIRRRLLHRGLCAKVPLYRMSLTENHRRLSLQWAHEHRAWQADWHKVVFSDESCFNLWDHDSRIRVRRCAGERCLPECVIERHSGLTTGVMDLGIPGAIFQQDNVRPHVAKTVRDLCSAQHMLLLPWPAYSPVMSPIEHVWDLAGRRPARDPRPAPSKDELLLAAHTSNVEFSSTSRYSKSVRLHATSYSSTYCSAW
ncbi:transposable element Tcb2 transposase [Trichonephila clavipes]|nr:transposable element Tcb2 transposase [Trichonephila clavipes]